MTITSFGYFTFIAVSVIVYYILPKKIQWMELLAASIIFYCMAGTPSTYIFLVISTLIAWGVTIGLKKYRDKNGTLSASKGWQALITISIVINIILWFVMKGNSFIADTQSLLGNLFPGKVSSEIIHFIAPLGMGYYTLQIIGYTLDCFWGTVEVQKNPFKLLLFTSFFPQMTTGPISHYANLITLYEKHKFSYENIAHGVQRILWGVFKKLVVAERTGVIVNAVWADLTTYNGLYTWIALLIYPIQMYADFSGCMDIILGTAECFDIKLVENFNNPFFSRTSQEFWQRWHISLGAWAKDYVLYPLLKSQAMIKLNKNLKKKCGKKAGKFLATSVGMLVLWLVMGIWHGAFKYIMGVSLWYWIILMLGDLAAPLSSKIAVKFQFKVDSFGWRVFQAARTYLIYAIGAAFFRASNIKEGFSFVRLLVETFNKSNWNPWILVDGSILNLGVSYKDINIIVFSIVLMLIVGLLREKYGYARIWLDTQPILFRWIMYIGLFFGVLILGVYGPNYIASNFIYGDF